MSNQTVCQQCKLQFLIKDEDMEFYSKLNVPPPTFCPQCRFLRRIIWRNERILYKRPCDAPGHAEQLISNYAPDSPNPVYDQEFWWSDGWDPMAYGQDYDFSRPFFEQFKELLAKVPLPNVTNLQSVQSEYCNFTYQAKNCYLVFASDLNEDSSYLYHAVHCRNSMDLLGCNGNEYCYECVHSHNCYQCKYAYFSTNCLDSTLIYNCNNCQNCFGCVNLKNAKYCIFNEQYTKEDYDKKLQEFELGNREKFEAAAQKFWNFTKRYPRRFADLIQCINSSGEYLTNAKNCSYCFDIEGPIEDSKFVTYGPPHTKDAYDSYGIGENAERIYEVTSCGAGAQNVLFCPFVWAGHSCRYSHFCRGSSNIFGCIGLRSKEYCILNKQYTKEEYDVLVSKIIEHMNVMPHIDSHGRKYSYGEFFPAEVSPFSYNETIAQEYVPLDQTQAESQGYKWRQPDTKSYQATLTSNELPKTAEELTPNILQEIIGCIHAGTCAHQCTTAFRITPAELDFYKRLQISVPQLCPNCRHYERLAKRNPLSLWHGKCMCIGTTSRDATYTNTCNHFHGSSPCSNEFETSYGPERPEILYCEQCYQAEVS